MDAAIVLAVVHAVDVQSCTAPIVCPISCAMTFHSVEVLATTFAPLTVCVSWIIASFSQSCPSHAKPTEGPVSHVVNNVHRAFESLFRVPLQAENMLRRVSIVTLLVHGTFQGAVAGADPGQLASLIMRDDKPRVMLKVLSNKLELEDG